MDDQATMLAALKLQLDWGADDALEDAPPGFRLREAAALPANLPSPEPGGAAAGLPPLLATSAPPRSPTPRSTPGSPLGSPLGPTPRPVPQAATQATALASAAVTLEELREAMRDFTGSALRETATQLVFADGQADARVMLLGEAPGADEDRLGRPFVGLPGQLLDQMLASVGLSRDVNVYIANILPWRPPGNRTPTDAEMQMFLPFVRRHIALIQPQFLVLLGGTAAKAMLSGKDGITKMRGKWHQVMINEKQIIPALPTLHPAYLLRSPAAKKDAWHDWRMLRHRLNEG